MIAPVRLGKASGAALLPGFPGTLEREALGAAEWLLGDTAGGVTGRTLAVDFGRSW